MEQVKTTEEWELELGEHLKQLRLQKNIDRETLCKQAGVSTNALRNLENGAGSSLKTLIRVVRALGREEWLAAIAPRATINPLHLIRNHPVRQRASRSRKHDSAA